MQQPPKKMTKVLAKLFNEKLLSLIETDQDDRLPLAISAALVKRAEIRFTLFHKRRHRLFCFRGRQALKK